MIEWWGWLLIIAGGILLGMIVAVYGVVLMWFVGEHWIDLRRRFETYRHNKRARQLRLQRGDWFGYPMPHGDSGSLVITEEMQRSNSVRMRDLKKAIFDRANDLGVDVYVEQDQVNETRDILVYWRKPSRWRKNEGRISDKARS